MALEINAAARLPFPSRIRRLTPAGALGLLPYTTGLAAALCMALVSVKAWRQPTFAHARTVTALSLGVLIGVLLLYAYLRARASRLPAWIDVGGAVSWLVGLQLGVLLLTIPVLALVTNIAADQEQWTWPFLNKRWLIALYFLGVATLVVFPVAFECVRSSPRGPALSAHTAPRRSRHRFAVGGTAVVVLLVWFFAGPPWHLDRHYRDIEYHEQVHLGPLQAIAKGYLPYLGPASTQYGPGSQLLIYGVMRQSTQFDLAAFRTAWAAINFSSLVIVALVASWWLAPAEAVAVVLLAVTYSPLSFYGTSPDGALHGFFGWANAFRYLAPLLVVPGLVRAAGTRWVVLLGLVWGVGAWIAQENLFSTGASAGLLLVLLGLTRTARVGAVLRSARDLAIGFGLVAAPVVLYYAHHQAAGAFLENYFALPRAVSAGFQNMWWVRGDSAVRTFYALPFFLLALSVATLWRLPAMTLRGPLDDDGAVFLAFLCVQLVCYQVALLRTDSAHLQNTTIALPFILVLGARQLPQQLAATSRRRTVTRWAFVIVALAVLPAGRLLRWREILVTPAARFVSRGAPAAIDTRVSFARARPSDQPFAMDGKMVSRRDWLAFAGQVGAIVGDRRSFVATVPFVTSGALYFLADLTPAPFPLDGDTMILNERGRLRILEDMRAHPDRYEAFIGTALDAPDARVFTNGHPGAERIERRVNGETVYILLARPARLRDVGAWWHASSPAIAP